ncbi:MAG: hypothetical protein ABR505_12375 [Actinomycetota bacterium]
MNGSISRKMLSLDLIREEVLSERDLQLRHFDGLDAKAGVLLGFAGLLAALAPIQESVLIELARAAAVIAAGAAFSAFWPRDYPVTDVRGLRQHYLYAQEEFTKRRLMDTQIIMIEQARDLMNRKATRLKIATASLAVGVLLAAAGFAVRYLTS